MEPGGLTHQISKSVKYERLHFTADAEKQQKMKQLVQALMPGLSRALCTSGSSARLRVKD